jgi:hypothetical protein
MRELCLWSRRRGTSRSWLITTLMAAAGALVGCGDGASGPTSSGVSCAADGVCQPVCAADPDCAGSPRLDATSGPATPVPATTPDSSTAVVPAASPDSGTSAATPMPDAGAGVSCAADGICQLVCAADPDCAGSAGTGGSPGSSSTTTVDGAAGVVAAPDAPASVPVPDAGIDSPVAGSTSTAPVSTTVGSEGGTVVLGNSEITLDIPPEAVSEDTLFTIKPIDSPRAGTLGQAYEIKPDGLVFKKPVFLTFKYSDTLLEGKDATTLAVATRDGDAWKTAEASLVDTVAKTVTAVIMYLSNWSLVTTATPCPTKITAGSLCNERGRWCKTDSMEGYCNGTNWVVAQRPSGCPQGYKRNPSGWLGVEGQSCGNYMGVCEYFDFIHQDVATCLCENGKFACLHSGSCPLPKYVFPLVSSSPSTSRFAVLLGLKASDGGMSTSGSGLVMPNQQCVTIGPAPSLSASCFIKGADILPLVSDDEWQYVTINCRCVNSAYECQISDSTCPPCEIMTNGCPSGALATPNRHYCFKGNTCTCGATLNTCEGDNISSYYSGQVIANSGWSCGTGTPTGGTRAP